MSLYCLWVCESCWHQQVMPKKYFEQNDPLMDFLLQKVLDQRKRYEQAIARAFCFECNAVTQGPLRSLASGIEIYHDRCGQWLIVPILTGNASHHCQGCPLPPVLGDLP